MKRIAPLLFVLLASCTEEASDRGNEFIPVFWIDARTDPEDFGSFDVIENACAFWGLPCIEATTFPGSIVIIISETSGHASDHTDLLGFAVYDPCEPVIWSFDDEVALAHEIGHAFTLEHVNDPANIMYFTKVEGMEHATLGQDSIVAEEADQRCE